MDILIYLKWSAFDSLWFWILLFVQWIVNLTWIGGVPADVIERAKQTNDGLVQFNRFVELHKDRMERSFYGISSLSILFLAAISFFLIYLALFARMEIFQALLIIIFPQAYVVSRDWALVQNGVPAHDRLPHWQREKSARIFIWIGVILLAVALSTVNAI